MEVIVKIHQPATIAIAALMTIAAARILDVRQGSGTYPSVQSAAAVAVPGDTVLIHAGTYRETVRPAQSGTAQAPITFRGAPGELAKISACETIAGWTEHDLTNGRRIYKAQMPFTCNSGAGGGVAGNDQVFLDGVMMVEARWPNIPDSAHPAAYRKEYGARSTSGSRNGNTWSYTASGLPGAGNSLVGAYINTLSGAGWTPGGGPILSSANGSLTANIDLPNDAMYNPTVNDLIYLWGAYSLLDHGREWFRDASGTLYLWTAAGDNPSTHLIEAKRRMDVFDLADRAYITICDLAMFGGEINTNSGTDNLVIDNTEIQYICHYLILGPAWSRRNLGLMFEGDNVVIRDSYLANSGETGIRFAGGNCLAENNVICNCTYLGNPGMGIWMRGSNNKVLHNTVFTMGNVGILTGEAWGGNTTKSLVSYNEVYDGYISSNDGGLIFNSRNNDCQGTVVSYNWIHGSGPAGSYVGSGGFYTEGGVSNLTVHHNVIWNLSGGGINLGPGGEGTLNNIDVYNNTLYNTNFTGPVNSLGTNGDIRNNISNGFPFGNYWGTLDHNINKMADAGLNDPASLDFTLRSNSPAINAGVEIAGVTDGFIGSAPDIGAYESGKPAFIAGAVITDRHIAGLDVTWDNAAFPDKKFFITGMPFRRKLPNNFKLKIGTSAAGGTLAYNVSTGVSTMTGLSVGLLTGSQPIYGQIGDGTPVATGESINLGTTGLAIGSTSFRSGVAGLKILPGSQMMILTNVEYGTPVLLYRLDGSCAVLKPGAEGFVLPHGSSGVYLLRIGDRFIRLAAARIKR